MEARAIEGTPPPAVVLNRFSSGQVVFCLCHCCPFHGRAWRRTIDQTDQSVAARHQCRGDCGSAAHVGQTGIDPEKIEQVINNSGTGRSCHSFLHQERRPGVCRGLPLQAAYKDLVSAATLTAKRGHSMPVTLQQRLINKRFEGLGELDKGAMIQVYEDLPNVRFERQKG